MTGTVRSLLSVLILALYGLTTFSTGGHAQDAASAQALPSDPAAPMHFGMDAGSVDTQIVAGAPPDVASIWLGPWTLQHGWRDTDRSLSHLRAMNVTPAIHYYYWGDDLTPGCLSEGCWSSLHDTRKDASGWDRLAREAVAHLEDQMEGDPVIIFLETEFNRAEVAHHEPLDRALADKARFFREQYPSSVLVMPLGNWNHAAWSTWDRTAAEVDYVGVQALRAWTQHEPEEYLGAFNATLDGLAIAQTVFDRPLMVHDVGLAGDADKPSRALQAKALSRFFDGMDDLRDLDVRLVLYRSWYDDPRMDSANHFGIAERHWGVSKRHVVTPKPAAWVWVDGVREARGLEPIDLDTRLDHMTFALDEEARRTSSRAAPAADQPPIIDTRLWLEDGQILLDATPTMDPNGQRPSFQWRINGEDVAAGATAAQDLAPGTYEVELVVDTGNHTVWGRWDLQVHPDEDVLSSTAPTTSVVAVVLSAAALAAFFRRGRKKA